jgi:predicted RNase H-like HicB family nuclease
MDFRLTFVFKETEQGYVGFVQELPKANVKGESVEEVRQKLVETVHAIVKERRRLSEEGLRGVKGVTRELIHFEQAES